VIKYHEDNKEFKDDLHVRYDPDKLTTELIVAEVRKQGFQGPIVMGTGRSATP
jgi:hypothetical protein